MGPWGWILVYLVGFTLFQLLLFRYFSDDDPFDGMSFGSGERSAPRSVEQGRSLHATNERLGDDAEKVDDVEEGVQCRHCGAVNADEQSFTYCRECLCQLR